MNARTYCVVVRRGLRRRRRGALAASGARNSGADRWLAGARRHLVGGGRHRRRARLVGLPLVGARGRRRLRQRPAASSESGASALRSVGSAARSPPESVDSARRRRRQGRCKRRRGGGLHAQIRAAPGDRPPGLADRARPLCRLVPVRGRRAALGRRRRKRCERACGSWQLRPRRRPRCPRRRPRGDRRRAAGRRELPGGAHRVARRRDPRLLEGREPFPRDHRRCRDSPARGGRGGRSRLGSRASRRGVVARARRPLRPGRGGGARPSPAHRPRAAQRRRARGDHALVARRGT